MILSGIDVGVRLMYDESGYTRCMAAFFCKESVMDVNTVVSLIGSVGFPIVACCAMAWFIATSFKDFRELVLKNNMLVSELIELMRNKDVSDDNDDE